MKIIKSELVKLVSRNGKEYRVFRLTLENGVVFDVFPTFCGKWPNI